MTQKREHKIFYKDKKTATGIGFQGKTANGSRQSITSPQPWWEGPSV